MTLFSLIFKLSTVFKQLIGKFTNMYISVQFSAIVSAIFEYVYIFFKQENNINSLIFRSF